MALATEKRFCCIGVKRYTDKEKEIIIQLHKENYNTVEIAKKIGRSQSGVEKLLIRNGCKMRHGRYTTDEELADIYKLYTEGKTCREIFNKYNYKYNCEEAIQRIIQKAGLSRGKYSKPVILNHDYFESIDNQRKAYWIGMLLADGCVMDYPNRSKKIKLELKVQDKYIIEEFAKDIETDLLVRSYKYSKKHNSTLTVSSNKMAQDLSKFGIVERKTFKTNSVPIIRKDLMRHLIRGYFDGDGCITLGKRKDQYIHRATAYFCGTEEFLNELNCFLNREVGLEIKELIDMNKYGSNIFNLRYIRNAEIINLYEYLYHESEIFLHRKKEKFELFINERK